MRRIPPFVSCFRTLKQRPVFFSGFHSSHSCRGNELKEPAGKGATPGMRQYLRMKDSVPGYLLLFQMGDFFEIFYEDAINASKLLDLTLTSRHKGDHAIPMCGIPIHTLETYIGKLIKKGQMVAVCEQVNEDMKPSGPSRSRRKTKSPSPLAKVVGGAGGVVKREITRLVSPGTLIEDHLLQPRSNNYIASIHIDHSDELIIGITWMDLSTGGFHYASVLSPQDLQTELHRIQPAEIICSYPLKAMILLHSYSLVADAITAAQTDLSLQEHIKTLSKHVVSKEDKEIVHALSAYRSTPRTESQFKVEQAETTLLHMYDVEALHSIGTMNVSEVCAAGALLQYIAQTQKGKLPSLSLPYKHIVSDVMHIDSTTFQCLELVKSNSGDSTNTLLSTIDQTITGPGARLLASRIVSPLISPQVINDRLDGVEFFVKNEFLTESLRLLLKQCHDMERSLQRISLRKCGPRDLSSIAQTIEQLRNIADQISVGLSSHPTPIIQNQVQQINHLHQELQNVCNTLNKAIVESPPMNIHTGNFVKKGFSKELDEVTNLQNESKNITGRLQTKYRSMLGVSSLKIKTNLSLGMHIEIPTIHHNTVLAFNKDIQCIESDSKPENLLDISELLSAKKDFRHVMMHCQTMLSAMRYKTEELSLLDQRIQRAEFDIREREEKIFDQMTSLVLEYASQIRQSAQLIASIDVSSSLGLLANMQRYCRPVLHTNRSVNIQGGRHPVVESLQQSRQSGSFTPNHMVMDDEKRIFLLTGPNMGGKSTYLRQVAIHAILAQSGSFIPADSAEIGIFDRIFSRVGAADDVKNDQSTFMMEMQEAANILKMATPRSLVIVDELGRGTSTLEGLSIAWAVLEHLHNNNNCRTIFATHYHELAQLHETLSAMECYQMKIMENENGVIAFLHKVIQGVADKSYGVHVAKLAGIPDEVTQRAEILLQGFIAKSNGSPNTQLQGIHHPLKKTSQGHMEDDKAHYIRVDKKNPDFGSSYDLLCRIALPDLTKE